MKRKIYRVTIALLLVCVLVVSWSPIRAEAIGVAAGAGALSVAAGTVVVAVLIGAGLQAADDSGALDNIVSSAVEALEAADQWIKDGNITVYHGLNDEVQYMIPMGLVEWLRDWLWSSPDPVLSYGFDVPANLLCPDEFSECYAVASSHDYSVVTISSLGYWGIAYSDYKPFIVVDGNIRLLNNSGSYTSFYYYSHTAYNALYTTKALACYDSAFYVGQADEKTVCPVDGIIFDHVGLRELSFGEAYPEWIQRTAVIPGALSGTDEDMDAVPIGLGATYEDTRDKTQEDIWIGTSEYVDSSTEIVPDTVGLADIWQLIKGIPAALADVITGPIVGGLTKIGDLVVSIPQTIADAISAIFVPSVDFLEAKVATLKARFPFIDGTIGLGEFVSESLSSDLGPPVLYVDFGPATTDTYGHKKYILTDFSWYAPYKPTVDALMSSILWAFYGWRIFVRLPSIIGGEGGQVINVAFHSASARNAQEAERDRKKNKGG